MERLLHKDIKAITLKAIEVAKAGDVQALRLIFERVLPPTRETPLQINLPIPRDVSDVPATLSAILEAAALGEITSSEAERLSRVVETFSRAHELATFDARLKALEGRDAK